MLPNAPKNYLRGILAGIWLLITLSLAAWWMFFSLRQLGTLSAEPLQLHRYHHMLLWEGSFLLLVVLAGGVALLYLSYLDLQRHKQLKAFFSAFSHDLKTSLTSVRLQAEIMEEEQKASPSLQRLLREIVRLELQLDNSLFLANTDASRLLKEKIPLDRLVQRLGHYWPELRVELAGNATLLGDQRAIESVFKNLIQNSRIHGEASLIAIHAEKAGNHRVEIKIRDDGKGFNGELEKLGTPYLRLHSKSGSGLGLYLSKQLLRRMDGTLNFAKGEPQGLEAKLSLPGEMQ